MLENLFGSRTRVKLLTLLCTHPDEAFYVRELTRRLEEQINGVRRELANLQSLGIVQSREEDRRLYYRLDRRYPYLPELIALFQKVAEDPAPPAPIEVQTASGTDGDLLTARVRTVGAVGFAMLSGAFLGREAVVDLFIVGEVNKARLSRLVSECERDLGREINFSVLTPDEYAYRRSLYDRFLSEVLELDKVVLIDNLGVVDVEADAEVEPEPQAPPAPESTPREIHVQETSRGA